MASIKQNLKYQTVYMILSSMLSLIVAPYISRILGAEKLGVFSYTISVASYFTLIAMLGIQSYGMRAVAEVSDNLEERSEKFWNIFYLQLIASIVAIIFYIFYIIFICKNNILIAIIQGITIVSCLLDVNWLFEGIENFKFISKRDIIFRIINVILIFLIVKRPEDLWLYTLLMAGNTLLMNFVLWIFVPKVVKFKKCNIKDSLKHLKPNLVLLVPISAILIYGMMDKTMLGIFSDFNESGQYYNADKIISTILRVSIIINSVMSPRMSSILGKGNKKSANDLFYQSFNLMALLFIGAAFGVAAVSKEFTPLYFGKGYEECVILIIMLSPIILIKSCGSVIRQQYLIPHRLDRIYAITVTIGLLINFIINYFTIPLIGARGAALGTVITEFMVGLLQIIAIKDHISFKNMFKEMYKYLFIGLIMYLAVRFTARLFSPSIISLFVEIMVGAIVYISLILVYFYLSGNKILINLIKKNK